MKRQVAPLAGAWIEIEYSRGKKYFSWSLPSRERGLKLVCCKQQNQISQVAPLAGAWIEIRFKALYRGCGALSLPSRERGLKLPETDLEVIIRVAPLAGAWIEIKHQTRL